MPALACNTNDLLAAASCYLCLSDLELLAAKVLLREQLAGGTPRTITELLAESVAWAKLSAHQRLAIELAQIDNDALDGDARAELLAASRAETACYCASQTQLLAIIAMQECEARQA